MPRRSEARLGVQSCQSSSRRQSKTSGKPVIMRSSPFPKSRFVQCSDWYSSSVGRCDDGPFSSFQPRSSGLSSFYIYMCAQIVFLTTQFFFPETQPTCDDCFARQSVGWVISLDSGLSQAVDPQQVFEAGRTTLPHAGLAFPLHASLLAANSLNL